MNSEQYLAKYNSLVERRLLPKIEMYILEQVKAINANDTADYVVSLKPEIRQWFEKETALIQAEAEKGAYKEAIEESKSVYGGIDGAKITQQDINLLGAIKKSGFDALAAQASLDANTVWKSLVNYSVTGNQQSLNKALLSNLSELKVAKHGGTIVQTNIDTFFRQANAVRAVAGGVTKYKYMGPPPERKFCQQLFKSGRVFSIDEIQKMDNGQIGDVFTSAGGYNCRHYWSPVVDD